MSSWDTKQPVSITKFELLCVLRQYGVELGRPDVSEPRVNQIIARMVELRGEFERAGQGPAPSASSPFPASSPFARDDISRDPRTKSQPPGRY